MLQHAISVYVKSIQRFMQRKFTKKLHNYGEKYTEWSETNTVFCNSQCLQLDEHRQCCAYKDSDIRNFPIPEGR